MTWMAAATIAAGALGAGASIYGGQQAGAASKAASQQAAAGQEAAAQGQILQQQQTQQQMQPYTALGRAGTGELGYLMGLPGYGSATQNPSTQQANLPLNPATGQPFTMADFVASVNRMAPGHTGNVGDAQTLYGWYTSGQLGGAGLNQVMGLPAGTVKDVQQGAPGGAAGGPGAAGAPGAAQPGGGFGSLMQPFTPKDLQNTPGYQFQLQQGMEALQNKAAAGGTLASPNTQKALADYAEGLAGTTYNTAFQQNMQQKQQEFNQLMGVTQLGAQTTGQVAGLGGQAQGNIGGAQIGMANAAAGGILGQAQANQQMYQNLAATPGLMASFYNKLPGQTPDPEVSVASVYGAT